MNVSSGKRWREQAIVVLAFVAAAVAVAWMMVSTNEWYVPTLVLIVAGRYAYDHFFA